MIDVAQASERHKQRMARCSYIVAHAAAAFAELGAQVAPVPLRVVGPVFRRRARMRLRLAVAEQDFGLGHKHGTSKRSVIEMLKSYIGLFHVTGAGEGTVVRLLPEWRQVVRKLPLLTEKVIRTVVASAPARAPLPPPALAPPPPVGVAATPPSAAAARPRYEPPPVDPPYQPY